MYSNKSQLICRTNIEESKGILSFNIGKKENKNNFKQGISLESEKNEKSECIKKKNCQQ